MKAKIEQKVIVVYDVDTDNVNKLLDEGWIIVKMSACGYQWNGEGSSLLYVYLIREIND